MLGTDGFDPNEGVILKEDMKFIDGSGKQINGDLVITNRWIVFMKKQQVLHANALEAIRGAHAQSAGNIGAYLSIDFESPDGKFTLRYKESVRQTNRLLEFIEPLIASGGPTFGGTEFSDTIRRITMDNYRPSPARVSPKSTTDTLCQGVICCMWFFVGLIFRVMMMGATITPGAELIPGGLILLTFAVTCWWVGIKGKKAWLCYGVQVGSDKPQTVHVRQMPRQTAPQPSPALDIESIYTVAEMTDPLKGPKCGAEFAYRKRDIVQNTLKCQNCLEDFMVE